jgi:protocatechuate 3,4-dioxygenase beta subunit
MGTDGRPVANADVRLVTWTKNNTRYDVKKVRSDKNGEFVFKDVRAGQHRLAAFFEDFASRQARYKGESINPSLQQPVALKLLKMPSIDVHVVSKEGGKPIENANVRLIWTDTQSNNRSDSNGRVLLRALTHEVWHVQVLAKGFGEQQQAVNLNNTEAAKIAFELEPGGVLYGTVRDDAGQPIADAGVSVWPADHRGGANEYMRTKADGRYRFEHVPLNKRLELSSSRTNYLDDQRQMSLAGAQDVEQQVDLVLKRRPHGGSLRGTVTDTHGKPIGGVIIMNQGRRSSDVRKATTDDQGQFLLDNVYEGSIGHEIVVKATGFAPQQLKFKPGSKEQPGEIAIKLEVGHRIRGRVVDDAGKPIVGANVYYSEGNHGFNNIGDSTTTDAGGKFEFDSLPSDAPFSIGAAGYSEIESTKLPLDGTDEVVVKLPQEGMIRGKVIDAATRKPISPFNVQLTFSPDRRPDEPGHHLGGARSTTPTGERFANPEGTFELKELILNMPLQLTVTASGYERQVYRRVVAQAKSEADEIVVPLLPVDSAKLVAIRGRVVDANGAPVASAELRLITADKINSGRGARGGPISSTEYPFNWQMIQSGQVESVEGVSQFMSTASDKDGSFAFDKVRSTFVMEIVYWGEGISQGRLEQIERLTDEERSKIAIVAVEPGVIRGKIDRKTMPDVSSITLTGADSGVAFDYRIVDLSSNVASYELRNIPPGKYKLEVNGEKTRTSESGFRNTVLQRHSIDVRSGETVILDITKQ